MRFDSSEYPYPSQRMLVYAKNGMVATSQPLAAQAGLRMLLKGGNAVDAAIATAAALTVVEPTSNGLGADSFSLIWHGQKLYGLNASGPAPRRISRDKLGDIESMPLVGWPPVTVPGAVASWQVLSERFGRLPFADLLQPAIEYAEQGYPLSPTLAHYWQRAFVAYKKRLQGELFEPWFATFAPDGRAPRAGEVWRSPGHAFTLARIAASKGEDFYQGEIADRLDQYSQETGGFLRKDDLAAYQPEWVDPISVNYRGYDIWEIPPNGQGLVALIGLNILAGFELVSRDSVTSYHRQIESIKLAFVDGLMYISDPDHMSITVEKLLSPTYAARRRRLIGESALLPEAGRPQDGGTVYLAAADQEGNMVSFIQSNYMGFGSGVVIPETGIALQNRGHTFSLDPDHVNCLKPGKRTYHTIIPGFITKDGQAVGPFGVMGGYMQPQGHLQVISNLVDFHLNPQAALDAPRWRWVEKKVIEVEQAFPQHLVKGLLARGHDVRIPPESGSFGRGQVIMREEDGVLVGATEPRTDGCVAAW